MKGAGGFVLCRENSPRHGEFSLRFYFAVDPAFMIYDYFLTGTASSSSASARLSAFSPSVAPL